jgi:hypothetical protein
MYHFYKVIHKQTEDAHMFLCPVVVLATTDIAVNFPHVGAIGAEASCICYSVSI